jgi:hypothetical protein
MAVIEDVAFQQLELKSPVDTLKRWPALPHCNCLRAPIGEVYICSMYFRTSSSCTLDFLLPGQFCGKRLEYYHQLVSIL